VRILDPNRLVVATLTEEGIARTGPNTDYSRLTLLPAGTQDQVIAPSGGVGTTAVRGVVAPTAPDHPHHHLSTPSDSAGGTESAGAGLDRNSFPLEHPDSHYHSPGAGGCASDPLAHDRPNGYDSPG
jgi:hypothetical protein